MLVGQPFASAFEAIGIEFTIQCQPIERVEHGPRVAQIGECSRRVSDRDVLSLVALEARADEPKQAPQLLAAASNAVHGLGDLVALHAFDGADRLVGAFDRDPPELALHGRTDVKLECHRRDSPRGMIRAAGLAVQAGDLALAAIIAVSVERVLDDRVGGLGGHDLVDLHALALEHLVVF